MWITLEILLTSCVFWTHCFNVRDKGMATVRSFVSHSHPRPSSAVVFLCHQKDATLIYKDLSDEGIPVSVILPAQTVLKPLLLKTEYYHLAVIVDVACEDSIHFLAEASQKKYFSCLYRWLLLSASGNSLMSNYDGDGPVSSDGPLITALEQLDLPLDSHVTVVVRPGPNRILLQDLYRLVKGQPLTVTSHLDWSPAEPFPVAPRRDNYRGIVFPAATIMSPDEQKNLLDWRYKHMNSQTKLHYVLAQHVSRMLNFRLNVTAVESWGYPVNNSSSYGGVLGLLQRGEIEMASFGLLFKAARMDFLDYAGETVRYEGAFLFLKPSLSDVSNIYTLPFSRAVWVTYLVTMIVFSGALHITQRTESGIYESEGTRPLSLSDSVLTAVGIVCQEGTTRDPQGLPSRIILLSLLMLSLFLTTSYSAIIVSLLQTTSTAINSLKDLMNSPYTLSMSDVATNMNYVNETRDADIKDLYFKHLFTQPYHEAFTNSTVGVEKMLKGLYAFHGDADAFKIISETYKEHEKCRLKSIQMFSSLQLSLTVKKGTPYKEHIRQRVRWLKESGITDREYKYWIVQKPKCHGNTEGFTTVHLQDIFPALLVFTYGLVLALFMLILEILFKELYCLRCKHYKTFSPSPYKN